MYTISCLFTSYFGRFSNISFHLFGFVLSCVVVLPCVPGFANSFVYSLPSLPVNLNTTLVGRFPNLSESSSHTLLTGMFTVNPVVVIAVSFTSSLIFSGSNSFIFPLTLFSILFCLISIFV